MTNETDRRLLLRIAREAIVAHVCAVLASSVDEGDLAQRRSGAFVSLHKQGRLRGCIGHIEADEPLPRLIARCAVAACSSDPRFPPVLVSELSLLSIELSLLGPLEPISGPADIEIGRHGLVVEKRWFRGLMLPQVAQEWSWGCEQFLAQTCHKAGLPGDAWKQGAKLWRFEAEVFSEPEFGWVA
jgi:hypothetical protein